MNVAVIGVQGAVAEHVHATKKALENLDLHGTVSWAKNRADLQNADAAILPGGESTTISKLIHENDMHEALAALPIFGTCAGMVLLAKSGDEQVQQTGQKLLGRMDVHVNRNAFGRQRESFQTEIKILGKPFPGVFIRAPCVEKVWGHCKPLATLNDRIVAVEQGECLATAFHPELSGDLRLHEHFLSQIKR